MRETDMDELALLWTQTSAPEGDRLVERLAERVGWRARFLQYADLGVAVAIAGEIALLVLLEGGNLTALGGLLLVLGVGWGTWKRHALWNLENSLGAGSSSDLLADDARRTRSRLKRTNISLVSVVPIFLLAIWLGERLEESGKGMDPVALADADPLKALLYIGLIAAMLVYLVRARRRLLAELRGIEALRGEYDAEEQRDSLA